MWGECVAVDAIPNIEQFLNVSINILDLDNLPLLNTTGYIHESMVYKSAYDKGKLTCWLLFGSDHYDPITNIKGFLAARYIFFCEKCGFGCHKKEALASHKCGVCDDPVNKTDKSKISFFKIPRII